MHRNDWIQRKVREQVSSVTTPRTLFFILGVQPLKFWVRFRLDFEVSRSTGLSKCRWLMLSNLTYSGLKTRRKSLRFRLWWFYICMPNLTYSCHITHLLWEIWWISSIMLSVRDSFVHLGKWASHWPCVVAVCLMIKRTRAVAVWLEGIFIKI